MLSEQAIAVVVFLILLAIALTGLIMSSRNSERQDTTRRVLPGVSDPGPVQRF